MTRSTQAEIDWLYGLQHFGIKLGLHNIRALLERMDHPESAYRTVLVAGTNGKGSVTAMVHAILTASGVRTGMFTSPHLIRPNERIRIGDLEIGTAELCAQLARMRERILEAPLETHPSFFEVITATALAVFREASVRAAVLEVGLGGRLDATNAVDADLSVVVSIDLDHTKSLGDTLEQIAEEKGGIVKPGKPLVSGVVDQRALAVLERICDERGSPMIDTNRVVRLTETMNEGLTLSTSRGRYTGLTLSLPGRHQIHNARVALATSELLAERIGFELDSACVRSGLASVRWPGRLEWIRRDDDGPELLLDGAHNPAGVETLAAYLRSLGRPAPVALFGAMEGKLLDPMFASLAPCVRSIVITEPAVRRAADPQELARVARRYLDLVEVVPVPAEALDLARRLAGNERFVLVTGSLYLVGEILDLLGDRVGPGPVSM